jgi:hypothetical protein
MEDDIVATLRKTQPLGILLFGVPETGVYQVWKKINMREGFGLKGN